MLHIKRLNHQSVIRFRAEDRLLSSDFMLAFLMAFFFHLILFIAFQIVSPQAYEFLPPIPALCVEADYSISCYETPNSTCLKYQEEPILPPPLIQFPLGPTSYEESICYPFNFDFTNILDYESLDIDFDDDQN